MGRALGRLREQRNRDERGIRAAVPADRWQMASLQWRWQVSNGGGLSPRWRADGRELFFLTPQGEMKAVSVDGARSFTGGAPHTLFHVEGVRGGLPGSTTYEVTRNGERFLVNFTRPNPPDSSISVILNWAASR